MKRGGAQIVLFCWLLLAPISAARSQDFQNWVVTDSTLLSFPHGDVGQVLQRVPFLTVLAAGGHGQPAFLSAGFGDVFGARMAFDGIAEDSYLLPFLNSVRWSPTNVGQMAVSASRGAVFSAMVPGAAIAAIRPFWKVTNRPFVRVHYLTRDFGREEVFALFQKRFQTNGLIQPFGAIGSYAGWLPNSALHFHQSGFQVKKPFAGGKSLQLFAIVHQSEAGVPEPLLLPKTNIFPRLKRKLLEQRFQGRLRMGNGGTILKQSVQWQVRSLTEAWTNFNPYFYEANQELSGTALYRAAGRWGKQVWQVEPYLTLHRIRYQSDVHAVWLSAARIQDLMPVFGTWKLQAEAVFSLGNWAARSASIRARFSRLEKHCPTLTMDFEDHHGGFTPPVLRDSTSFHWNWLRSVPLFRAVQAGKIQNHYRFLEEVLAWPIWSASGGILQARIQGIHWLDAPGQSSISTPFHAANFSIWGERLNWHGMDGEAGGTLRAASSRSTQFTSSLPAAEAFASLEYHRVFFQGNLHAAFRILARARSARRANISLRMGAPVFIDLPAAAFWDVYAHFRVADLRFFFAFENLLNNADYSLPGYLVPGRHFRFGLVWDFWN